MLIVLRGVPFSQKSVTMKHLVTAAAAAEIRTGLGLAHSCAIFLFYLGGEI